ncbi:MAG: hypothetical protein IJE73_05085 [Muribaculaceae bacterium]|nr:hypothetical protein [Muribaculaceae bacterium]
MKFLKTILLLWITINLFSCNSSDNTTYDVNKGQEIDVDQIVEDVLDENKKAANEGFSYTPHRMSGHVVWEKDGRYYILIAGEYWKEVVLHE